MNRDTNTGADFDLTCWYLNQRRVLELVGLDALSPKLGRLLSMRASQGLGITENSIFKDALTKWLKLNNPPPLGKLIINNTLRPGSIFTAYTNFYCRGGTQVWKAIKAEKHPIPPMLAYAKLDDLAPGWRVECRFHHDHLTSESSWSELSGQKTLFIFAVVTGIADKKIEAIPYVIANPLPQFSVPSSRVGRFWPGKFQIYIDLIDSFNEVKNLEPLRDRKELNNLRHIPEQSIKEAFADIIGEPTVPKDWGGERSDLFSDRVIFEGERISTAFVFKGPAKFEPMTGAHLGKNGDQIDRLFSEPADLLVLQHCHDITPAVRGTMRAYAQQMGNLRLFCIIDGYDTVRLLRAYKKCGL
jgi:hypothetical protein